MHPGEEGNSKDMDVKPYTCVFDELSVVDGLVLPGERIVVTRLLRETMVRVAHEGHQGIGRTKQLLQAHVWFPIVDKMVEKQVGKCLACQATTPCHTREFLLMSILPKGPWEKVSGGFAGPFPSKDPLVKFASSTSADAVIPHFIHVFSTYGIPKEVKTDKRAPFNSSKFAKYTQQLGFKKRKVTTGWAEANGDVERFMQTIKKCARIAKIEGKAFKQEAQTTVGNFRAASHPATRDSPDKLMFCREIKRKLPEKVIPPGKKGQDPIRERDVRDKEKADESICGQAQARQT